MFKNLMGKIPSMINIPLVLQIFALINPFSSLPVLASAYTKKMNLKEIAMQSTFIALVVAIAMIFIGPFLFDVFNVSISAFRVAGGIIILLLGISTARASTESSKVDTVEVLVSLIATPLLTGPATISFLTIKTYELGIFTALVNTIVSFILVGVVFFLFASFIPKISMKIVGIISRVLGLFLTAVAIEMLAAGIKGMFFV
ncbi:MAG: MarC family protein [Candidatus Anstonellales archaeon]